MDHLLVRRLPESRAREARMRKVSLPTGLLIVGTLLAVIVALLVI